MIEGKKNDILNKLASMPVGELDTMRDKTQLELKDILHKYHMKRDAELVYKHETRWKLKDEGHSYGKIEQILRMDKKLYQLKRDIMALGTQKEEVKLKISIVESYFWKNKGG